MANTNSDIQVETTDKTAVVTPTNDIVLALLPDLRAVLKSLVAAGAHEIVLNLSHVQMVDSAGLGLLVAAHNSLNKTGGSLKVVGASADLLNLFQVMRLHRHFSVSGR